MAEQAKPATDAGLVVLRRVIERCRNDPQNWPNVMLSYGEAESLLARIDAEVRAGKAAEEDAQRRVNEIRDDAERRMRIRAERIAALEAEMARQNVQLDKISHHPEVAAYAGIGDGAVGDAVIALAGRKLALEAELAEAKARADEAERLLEIYRDECDICGFESCRHHGAHHKFQNKEGRIAELEAQLDGELAVRAMTVGRLGGTVEGKPTHSGNFLQRIDELREREHGWHEMVMAEAAELGLDWRDYKGVVPGDFKALMRELKDLLRYVVAEHDHKRPPDDPDTSGDRKRWRRIRKILEER